MNRSVAAFISIMIFIIWVCLCYNTDIIEKIVDIIGKLLK